MMNVHEKTIAGWMDGWMEGGREGWRDGGMDGMYAASLYARMVVCMPYIVRLYVCVYRLCIR